MTVPDIPKRPEPPWITAVVRDRTGHCEGGEEFGNGGPPPRTPESQDPLSAVTE